MADLTQTPADVHGYDTTELVGLVQGGEVIDPGDNVYLEAATKKYKKGIATAEAMAQCKGIAMSYCPSDGDYFIVAKGGDVDIGATLAVGENYVVSSNAAGKIAPEGDLGSGNFPTTLGRAVAANKLRLKIDISGVAHA